MQNSNNVNYKISSIPTDYVKIDMNDGNSMIIKLNNENTPITINNFKKLVNEKFYDGLIFHRVIKDFMIQGGDPTGTGMGGSNEKIKGEFKSNGVNNNLSHKRGVLSMARSSHPDSASSQFFIVHQDSTFLDGNYASFGILIEGFETLDKIASTKTDNSDRPIEEQKIDKMYFIDINE